MDWAGIALLSVGLATLQYVLEEGSRKDWFESTTISVLAVVAVIALCCFVARELTATVPAVEPVALQGQGLPLGHAHRRASCSPC